MTPIQLYTDKTIQEIREKMIHASSIEVYMKYKKELEEYLQMR